MTNLVAYKLAGKLTHMNTAVSGTRVCLFDYWTLENKPEPHFIAEQITDKRGDFAFSVRAGNYLLEVIPSDTTRFARHFLEVEVAGNCLIPIALKTASILSGKVQFGDGTPITNREVIITSANFPHYISEAIDKKGNYSFTLSPGKYQIGLRLNNLSLASKIYSVELNKDAKFDLTVPRLFQFSGNVFDNNNQAVADVRVKLNWQDIGKANESWQNIFSAVSTTNEQGQFVFNVLPGEYCLEIIAPLSKKLSFQKIVPIIIDQDFHANYQLEPGYLLTGNISFNTTNVSQLPVLAVLNGEGLNFSQLVNDAGQTNFVLPIGNYQLAILPQPDSLVESVAFPLAPIGSKIELVSDKICHFNLQPGIKAKGRISGINNEPMSRQLLSFYCADGAGFNKNLPAITSCFTNHFGMYEIYLTAAKYWLLINDQIDTARLIEVKENSKEAPEKLELSDMCTITFEFNSDDNKPVENCLVSWQSYDELLQKDQDKKRHEFLSYSDENGVCRLVMPSGIYSFSFEPRNNDGLQAKHIRQLSINQNLNRKIILTHI